MKFHSPARTGALAALSLLAVLTGCAPATVADRPAPPSATPRPLPAAAAGNPAVGGVAMPTGRAIAQNAATAPTLSTLVSAVNAAGLTTRLSGPGPFTVFAPTNEAFGRLAPGTVDKLLQPENRDALTKLVTFHVVAGALSGAELMRRIAAGGGRTSLTSVEGEPLTLTMTGNIVTLTDSGGNKSYVEIADVRQANGVVHVVNGVLIPRLN